jgi:hypothetical protein
VRTSEAYGAEDLAADETGPIEHGVEPYQGGAIRVKKSSSAPHGPAIASVQMENIRSYFGRPMEIAQAFQ